MTDRTGHYEHIVGKRKAVIAANPHLAARILGKRVYVEPKSTRITVDLVTGRRTIERAFVPAPAVTTRAPTRLISKPPAVPRAHSQTAKVTVAAYRDRINLIVRVCAGHWGVLPADILCSSRRRVFVHPRYACMLLIRDLLKISYPAIGWALGRRDHTTVLCGLARAEQLKETDATWQQKYLAAVSEITGEAR